MKKWFFPGTLLLLLSTLACQHRSSQPVAGQTAQLLLPDSVLPAYERAIDHAGLISAWDKEAFARGQIVYRTVCYNCHGNAEQQGSIPNAFRFWADPFRHAKDPYSIYQTLTRGLDRMPPQVQLTPQEKYDVIHFVREAFIKEANPTQYFEPDTAYLASLPTGDSPGPDPQPYHPWADMDYGDFLIGTYEVAAADAPPRQISKGPSPLPNEDLSKINFAHKGIAMRLDDGPGGIAAGKAWALFDHDLMRLAGIWTGEGLIDWEGILFNDRHNIYPRTLGDLQVANPIGPGWADPETGSFEDPRFLGLDGRPFGPLPRKWAHYKGLFYHGHRVIISYTVEAAQVLETYDLEQDAAPYIFSRTLNLSATSQPLRMRVAPLGVAVALKGEGAALVQQAGFTVLEIPAGAARNLKLLLSRQEASSLTTYAREADEPASLGRWMTGGPAHYPEKLSSQIISGPDTGAYAVDVLALPATTPWKCRLRLSGIDFIPETDDAVVCTIEGEVWRVGGITSPTGTLTWKRIASGLYQPLGIKIRDGDIYVGCRDQIAVLRDLNGDGETDFYESFNSDHQVTEHFHEFAMGLQTDEQGNFYYAKSARHARTPLVPQHGTLLRVSADGQTTDIIANGFRAANGVCRNPDGSFIVTDQEGHWNPMNRINWVREGGFYGNMYGYGAPADTTDAAMIPPLCWVDKATDRSPSELVWADSKKWGPLNGHLLNLSYGYGKVFVVPHEQIGDQPQGGMVRLPVPTFPTGIMRARFHPRDGQFYGCGMTAWGTSQVIQVGGLYRIRYTGKPLHLPVEVHALTDGVRLVFASPLDPASVADLSHFQVSAWDLKRTHLYGSKHYNTRSLTVKRATLAADGKSLHLEIPEIAPTWAMEINYQLLGQDGKPFSGSLQHTIYQLGKDVAVR